MELSAQAQWFYGTVDDQKVTIVLDGENWNDPVYFSLGDEQKLFEIDAPRGTRNGQKLFTIFHDNLRDSRMNGMHIEVQGNQVTLLDKMYDEIPLETGSPQKSIEIQQLPQTRKPQFILEGANGEQILITHDDDYKRRNTTLNSYKMYAGTGEPIPIEFPNQTRSQYMQIPVSKNKMVQPISGQKMGCF